MTKAIVLLARAPSAPGKTRLTTNLERPAAEDLRRALLLDTFETMCASDAELVVSYSPDDAREEVEALFESAQPMLVAQRGADLGIRMHHAMVDAFDRGVDAVVLIGSDLPNLPATHIVDAFAVLEAGHDLVLGPTDDGGYYLIGMTRTGCSTRVFDGIDWGSKHVFTQTVAAAQDAALRTALVQSWYDVDRPEDLGRVASDPAGGAHRTRAWLIKHAASGH